MKITSCPLDQRRGAHKVMNLVLLMGIAPLFLKLIFTRSLFFYLSLYPKRREEEDEQVIRHPGSTPSLSVYILAFSLYRRQHPITSVWGHTHTHTLGKCFFFSRFGMDNNPVSQPGKFLSSFYGSCLWNSLFEIKLLITATFLLFLFLFYIFCIFCFCLQVH